MSTPAPNPTSDLLQSALRAVVQAIRPFLQQLGDQKTRKEVLADLGLDPNTSTASLTASLDASLLGVDQYAGAASPDLVAFLSAFDDVLAIVDALKSFIDAAGVSDEEAANAAFSMLIGMLSTSYMRTRHPLIYAIARNLGFLEQSVFGHVAPGFHENRFGEFFTDTYAYFAKRWSNDPEHGVARHYADGFFFPIGTALMMIEGMALRDSSIHFSALHGGDLHPLAGTGDPLYKLSRRQQLHDRALSIRLRKDLEDGSSQKINFNFQTVPKLHGGPGLLMIVAGNPIAIDGKLWKVSLRAPTGIAMGFLIGPEPAFMAGADAANLAQAINQGDVAAALKAGLGLRFTPQPSSMSRYTLLSTGTRLEFCPGELDFALGEESGGSFQTKISLIIDMQQTDGFLSKLFAAANVRVDADVALAYDNKKGLTFSGGGGLRINIPVSKSIGPLSLEQVQIGLGAHADKGFALDAATAIRIKLGPVSALVEQMGFGLSYGEGKVAVGFRPPKGLGITLDAKAIRGGGYLFFNVEQAQYAGVIEVEIPAVATIKAIGMITTRLPDGEKGFSLLVILSVEGLSIQLGFGFALEAIGGLFGLNRGVEADVLRDGIRGGTVGAIMFPKNPVENATTLLATLGKVFPPVADQYAIGLMVRITYAVDMVRLSLGVIVSWPEPVRVVLLGKIEVKAPNPAAPLVVFNLDVLGILDFGAKEASLDASLYDSRVLVFAITGDMAMRLGWGDQAHFAISIGGFHPCFNAPSGFPKLRRAAITLGAGDNPRLRSESYFALTSNTFQTGARTELYAAAAGFSVVGFIGWDLLIQFDPFRFRADFAAGLALKRGSTSLMSVNVEGTLAGFAPLWVSGKASFSILFFEVSFGFKFTLIDDASPPRAVPIDVLPLLTAALKQSRNWRPQLPGRYSTLVSLRKPLGAEEIVLHPLASLAVSQGIVPLDVAISQFGQAEPAGATTFAIGSAKIGALAAQLSPVEDSFAPAQFFDMSDDEKLTRPSFEKLHSGVRLGTDAVTHGVGLETTLTYESKIVDPGSKLGLVVTPYAPERWRMETFAKSGAVARGDARRTGDLKYATGKGPRIRFGEPKFAVASKTDLSADKNSQPLAPSFTLARQAMKAQSLDAKRFQVVGLEEVTT